MITEERHQLILSELKQKGTVRVGDLVEKFNISESTIRRDLVQLETLNYLKRVHGGAVLVQNKFVEKSFNDKSHQFVAEKDQIAKFAAALVEDGDSIYLDSGTSTYEMIKYLKDKEIVVVTNGLSHVESLIENGISCFVLGGKVKRKTKAVVGYEAITALGRYRFDKCFMGSNGVHSLHGFTTPDPEEAMIKENAIKASNNVFVLADESKFGEVSFTRFAEIDEATIITNSDEELMQYQDKTKVKVVRK